MSQTQGPISAPDKFQSGTTDMGYILIEDTPADPELEDDQKSRLILVGTHNDLNLYQI